MSDGSFLPAAEGVRAGADWFGRLFGSGAGNVEWLLLSLGVSAAAALPVSWLLMGFLTVGAVVKFKGLLFYLFAFFIVFLVITGMGVALR